MRSTTSVAPVGTDTPATLYSRTEHGGHQVEVIETPEGLRYTVNWPDPRGSVEYDSARKLVRALYNDGDIGPDSKDPGMSFERYFRLGRWAPRDNLIEEGPTVIDLLGGQRIITPAPPTIAIPRPFGRRESRFRPTRKVQKPLRDELLRMMGFVEGPNSPLSPKKGNFSVKRTKSGLLTVEKVEKQSKYADRPLLTATDDGSGVVLGIDLENRAHEVRKLLFAGFGRRIARKGYDPDDVLQEVYRGIMARNYGKCPWDERKSSFGHYVHMVCSCVLNNYQRKQTRRSEFEEIGVVGLTDSGDWGSMDAAGLASDLSAEEGGLLDWGGQADPDSLIGLETAVDSLSESLMDDRPDARLAREILPYVYQGYQRAEIARELGLEPSKIGRALSYLRKQAQTWAESEGIR